MAAETTPLEVERTRRGMTRLQLGHALGTTAAEVRSWEQGHLSRPGSHAGLLRWIPELELWVEGQRATWDRVVARAGADAVVDDPAPGVADGLWACREAQAVTVQELELLAYLHRFNSARVARTVMQCCALGGPPLADKSEAGETRHRLHRLQRAGLVHRAPDPERVMVDTYHSGENTRRRLRLEVAALSARDAELSRRSRGET